MLAGMKQPFYKRDFDRSLLDLQGTTDIVISGISERLNEHGNKSGWNSTCYMLADHWMQRYAIEPVQCTLEEARTSLYAWLEQRWNESAIRYVKRYL